MEDRQNMAGINADHILDIDRKLAELTLIPSERCIFRVHDVLRNENKKAYEPEVVAIGPYHHGKDNLQPMEEHKLRYLKRLLDRRNETSAERYIVAMRESEQKARKSYADPISVDSNKFVEMMLLDGCFIVELLRKNEKKKNTIATERPAKPGGKPGRPERPDRPDDKPSRTDRPGDKLGCPERPNRPSDKPGRRERPDDKPGRSECPERPDVEPSRTDRPSDKLGGPIDSATNLVDHVKIQLQRLVGC
ncbi:unnamed protein product [Camellia sinensis]